MKKFNLKRMIAYVLVAMLTLGVFSVSASAAEVDMDDYKAAVAAAQEAGIKFDAATKAELEAIVKEAAKSLDIVEEGADPAKSTFVSFAENPVKVVKYDGEAHGLRGVAVKTVGYDYVADTQNLYVGKTAEGTIYKSFDAPVEAGFYYAVCMYAGDADNYPSVGYGIVVILPVCEEEVPTEEVTEAPTEEATEAPEATEATEAPTEAPEVPTDATTAEKEAPKTGDATQAMTYVAAMVVALGAMAVILFRKKNA